MDFVKQCRLSFYQTVNLKKDKLSRAKKYDENGKYEKWLVKQSQLDTNTFMRSLVLSRTLFKLK